MSSLSQICPSEEALGALLEGKLANNEEASLAEHVAECDACQAALDCLAGGGEQTLANLEALGAEETEQDASGGEDRDEWAIVLDSVNEDAEAPGLGTLARLRILKHVASGGMGIVFKANDPSAQRIVAVKVLAPLWSANTTSRERFLREARAVAAIDHPNVLPIYSVEEEARYPYLVMPFNDGETLEQRVRRTGPLSFESIRRHTRAMALGLAEAHQAGIIHRDLKPANILLTSDDQVRIADFGLARSLEEPSLTLPGSVPGTPSFMAPEQVNDGTIDHRVDLFALGCLMQFMATGKAPFEGDRVSKVLQDVSTGQRMAIDREQPLWFHGLLNRLLENDPGDRLPNAQAVVRWLDDQPIKRRGRFLLPAAVLTLAAIATLGVRWWEETPGQKASVESDRQEARYFQANLTEAYARNLRTGDTFNDLHLALSSSKPRDTIELQGVFDIDSPLTTIHPLTLRAAEGTSPVVTTGPSVRCLIAHDDLELEGICLTKSAPYPRKKSRRPSLVWVRRANEVRFKQCRFVTPWHQDGKDEHLTGCLGVSNVSHCVIDQCEIIGLSSAGLNVDSNIPIHIKIRDSVMAVKSAMMRSSSKRGQASLLSLSVTHSLVLSQEGFTHIAYTPFSGNMVFPLEINLSHSLVVTSGPLMSFPDASPQDAVGRLSWQASHSQLTHGEAFMAFPSLFRPDHEVVSLSSAQEAEALGITLSHEEITTSRQPEGIVKTLIGMAWQDVTREEIGKHLPRGWTLPKRPPMN